MTGAVRLELRIPADTATELATTAAAYGVTRAELGRRALTTIAGGCSICRRPAYVRIGLDPARSFCCRHLDLAIAAIADDRHHRR